MDPQIEQMISATAQKYQLPVPIFRALIMRESGGNPGAVSPAGAIGLGQLMPGTARGLHVNPRDAAQNLDGSARYLKAQLTKFGSMDLALAAYNAGPGAVSHYGGIPPYAETRAYVKAILGDTREAGDQQAPAPPQQMPQAPQMPDISSILGDQQSIGGAPELPGAPSGNTVSILRSLGGTASKAAQGAQEPIPLPMATQPKPISDGTVSTQKHEVPVVPIQSKLQGQVPMVTGGNITQLYPNLHAASHTDWQHVNPRLLKVIDQMAKKRGVVAVIQSGYRSNDYSARVGGFKGDPHTKGVAVDAYINGHPIGDVITPDEWAKHGVRSGNTPGFYKGQPDSEHLDLIGLPVK